MKSCRIFQMPGKNGQLTLVSSYYSWNHTWMLTAYMRTKILYTPCRYLVNSEPFICL